MPANLDKFKELAIEQGHQPEEVDAFLTAQQGFGEATLQESVDTIPDTLGIPQQEIPAETHAAIRGLSNVPRSAFTPLGTTLPGGSRENLNLDVPANFAPSKVKVNTQFGVRSSADVFSGGINYGTDFGVKNVPVSVPAGRWKVDKSFSGARPNTGFIGNSTNSGYGNSVRIVNQDTGESLRFSHLDKVNVRPGQKLESGDMIGISGNTGNSSGPHLDTEYRNTRGQLSDVLRSRFKDSFITRMSTQ